MSERGKLAVLCYVLTSPATANFPPHRARERPRAQKGHFAIRAPQQEETSELRHFSRCRHGGQTGHMPVGVERQGGHGARGHRQTVVTQHHAPLAVNQPRVRAHLERAKGVLGAQRAHPVGLPVDRGEQAHASQSPPEPPTGQACAATPCQATPGRDSQDHQPTAGPPPEPWEERKGGALSRKDELRAGTAWERRR